MPRKPKYISARTVGTFLPKITKRVFERHGFPTAALITDWPTIAGPNFAAYSLPEKLAWPRTDPADGERRHGNQTKKPQHRAVLWLRVEGHRALDVQYERGQLIDRINSYFGYQAVTDIRIIQGPVPKKPSSVATEKPPAPSVPPADIDFSGIEDDTLREALQRLGRAPNRSC